MTSTAWTRPLPPAPARWSRAVFPPGRRWRSSAAASGLNLVGGDLVEVSPPYDPYGQHRADRGKSSVRDALCPAGRAAEPVTLFGLKVLGRRQPSVVTLHPFDAASFGSTLGYELTVASWNGAASAAGCKFCLGDVAHLACAKNGAFRPSGAVRLVCGKIGFAQAPSPAQALESRQVRAGGRQLRHSSRLNVQVLSKTGTMIFVVQPKRRKHSDLHLRPDIGGEIARAHSVA
jgi:hypothetical protein